MWAGIKLFFKMCGGEIFKTLRWLERPKVSLEVKNLVVLLSAQWLHCRLLGLPITVRALRRWGNRSTNVQISTNGD
jgi:hypothetical protein